MTENDFAIVEGWLREAMEFGEDKHNEPYEKAIQALKKVQEFEAIGTIEEFKALKEKSEPKKVEYFSETFQAYTCPFCETPINNGGMAKGVYCKWCGQKFDWSE